MFIDMQVERRKQGHVTKLLRCGPYKRNFAGGVKYTHTSRRKEVIITRLRLGKCRLNHYLYEMSKHHDGFYRAMHFSAKRGIAIACRLSVCPSVCPSVCL